MKNSPRFVFFVLFVLLIEPVAGQRSAPNNPSPIPSRSRSFSIPFEVRPDHSADPPKEVELMVSRDRGVRWHSADRQPIEAKKFDFKTEEDGELWFTFRTVTLSGATRQVGAGGPQLRVLVDSIAPTLELDMKQQPSGEMLVQWKAKDANIRGKRPDFAVTGALAEVAAEKTWTPLNVDGRHFRADETGADGQFLFWPENDVTAIELRATLTDSVGNKAEKTCSAKIKAVKLDEATRIRQALKADEEKPMTPDGRVENQTPPSTTPSTPTAYRSARSETAAVRVEPPRPVRMKKEAPVKPVSSAPKMENPVVQTEAEKEPQPASVDPLTESLIAGMGRFFDGGLSVEVAPKTEKPAIQEPSAGLPKLPSIVPAPAPTVKSTAPSPPETVKPVSVAASASAPQPAPHSVQSPPPPHPGKITGVSLNASTPQPQVIVKWHVGDAPWHGGQIDVLRSGDLQGPWLPMATNLPNTGEYWWYVSNEDYKPFYVMIQIRSMQGGVHLDATKSAVRIPARTAGR